ncbi:TetR-like C-terminal domain-containing protein [Halalkalibacter oceani]|uniref:TetR-like C-terminal domain-containing protein n=1 Tax=Halalkalibacter oceani TaxID=1653776 RepID=UPI003D9C96A9
MLILRSTSAIPNSELHAAFMASAFVGMIEWWIEQDLPYSPEYMAKELEKLYEKNGVYLPKSTL